jgi:ssDNA-specific exonuclease RecJ
MANVFLDLGLIDGVKHGKIQFKTDANKEKKDLNDSETFSRFSRLME